MQSDWAAWLEGYDNPGSSLRARLKCVQAHLRALLGERTGSSTRILSACAGDGRDVIEVVRAHPARDVIEAYLIERTPDVAAAARRYAARSGLSRVTVIDADAGCSDAYARCPPSDIVLFCGVLGWISEREIARTVAFLPAVAAPDAAVIWTHHHQPPDRTSWVRRTFEDAGFVELAFARLPGGPSSVGVHRLVTGRRRFRAGVRLFRFDAADSA